MLMYPIVEMSTDCTLRLLPSVKYSFVKEYVFLCLQLSKLKRYRIQQVLL